MPLAQSQTSRLLMWEPNGILYEIATDGAGFVADERVETLGECLVLPPFLEVRRTDIERGLNSI
jgi:glyoxalase family protein